MSARGLQARTTAGECPPILEGDRVSLLLTCASRGIALRLKATVRGAHSGFDDQRYGLAFTQPEGLEHALPSDLFGVFNRRRDPRTPLEPSPSRLTVAAQPVAGGAGRRVSGTLCDLSVSGASISVRERENPGFQLGDRITLKGRLTNSETPTSLVAHVRRVRKTQGAVLYGVEFDWETPNARDQQVLLRDLLLHTTPRTTCVSQRRIAERRISQRARPPRDVPIEVVLFGQGNRSASATLCDLSASGAGVVVRALEDPEFGDDESMELQLDLPGGVLGMIARVRRGLLIDDQVCYGLEFDPAATEDFESNRERILSFLAHQFGETQEPPLVAFS